LMTCRILLLVIVNIKTDSRLMLAYVFSSAIVSVNLSVMF
jgi:hypothetical protein